MFSLAGVILRGFLLLFGAVVLGLSVTLAKQQLIGSPPSETSFSSFVGGFGILVSLIGLVAIWVESIPAMIVMGIDALASLFYLAGGIALTVALKDVHSCTATDAATVRARYYNKILNGGCIGDICDGADDSGDLTPGRCQRAQADYVFEFLGFAFGLGVIIYGFMMHRRGGGGGRAAYV